MGVGLVTQVRADAIADPRQQIRLRPAQQPCQHRRASDPTQIPADQAHIDDRIGRLLVRDEHVVEQRHGEIDWNDVGPVGSERQCECQQDDRHPGPRKANEPQQHERDGSPTFGLHAGHSASSLLRTAPQLGQTVVLLSSTAASGAGLNRVPARAFDERMLIVPPCNASEPTAFRQRKVPGNRRHRARQQLMRMSHKGATHH